MKKTFALLSFTVFCLTLACSAMAYTIEIKTEGFKYVGRSLGGQMEYRMDGKVVGYAKESGGDYIYTDHRNKQIGAVKKVGNSWQFRAANSTISGYVEELGGRHIYKGGNNIIIGYAEKSGSRTTYKAGNNIVIGNADTNSMPFRPIPLEQHLTAINANSVCLAKVFKVVPGSPAEKADLKVNDFLITTEGKDWIIFDLLHSNCTTALNKVRDKLSSQSNEDVVMIVYRPAPNESNQARGQIVQISLPAGKRGYFYNSFKACQFYDRENSKIYAKQMKQVYQRWLESR